MHFRPKILHFYATHIKPPFFRTWLIGTIGPPYPESPLDNFRFPVGGCLAAWQAVSWPKLPKVTLLGPKNVVFGTNSFFCGQPQKNCYNHNGTPKRQPFCFDCISGGLREAVQVLFGPKIDYKSDFLRFTFITYLFHLSRTRLNAIIIVLYVTVFFRVVKRLLKKKVHIIALKHSFVQNGSGLANDCTEALNESKVSLCGKDGEHTITLRV